MIPKKKRWTSVLHASLLTPSLSLGVANKYMSDGFQIGEDHTVLQPWIGLHHKPSGVTLGSWGSVSTERAKSSMDEWDWIAQWSPSLEAHPRITFQPQLTWIYWFYPNSSKPEAGQSDLRGNKLISGGELTTDALAPHQFWLDLGYRYHHWFYWENNRSDLNRSGGRHALSWGAHSPIPGTPLTWRLANEWSYHTGFLDVNPGWSHTLVQTSLRSSFDFGSIEATVFRQLSFEPSVNPEDETWGSIQFSFIF